MRPDYICIAFSYLNTFYIRSCATSRYIVRSVQRIHSKYLQLPYKVYHSTLKKNLALYMHVSKFVTAKNIITRGQNNLYTTWATSGLPLLHEVHFVVKASFYFAMLPCQRGVNSSLNFILVYSAYSMHNSKT